MLAYTRLVLALALLATAGCKGQKGTTPDEDGGGNPRTLTVEPADATLLVQDGVADPVDFTLLADGVATPASWSLSNSSVGQINAASGRFTANALFAGEVTVTATLDGQTATATLTVQIDNTVVGDGVPPGAPDLFGDNPTTGDPESPTLLYPLDEAVIPSSLKPPVVQWEGGLEGDLYRVQLTAGLAKVTAYLGHSGAEYDYSWLVQTPSWNALIREALSAPLNVVVDRWVSASSETFRSETHALAVASASLNGAIYYWDLSDGKILRITKEGREDFMPFPPQRPRDGKRCVACHTLSRDGTLMAAELWDGNDFSTVFDLSEDLSVDPAPTVFPPDRYVAVFSTFNPESDRLLINLQNRLELRDPTDGTLVPTSGIPLPTTGASHPTWSPDGSAIAFIANHNGNWPVDFTEGDLAVIPVTDVDTFGATDVLRVADGLANSWPTWSPDSEWIAYARGENSRGRIQVGQNLLVFPGSLRIIDRDGGTETELATANGTGENSHLPNFSPFNEGGYFWLAFYTTRDYGNAQVGTKDQTRRQIWITAIDNNPQAGTDPSHVPYWLPDQDVTTHNMSSYWTLPPPPVVE